MKIVHLHQLEKQKVNIEGAEKAFKQVYALRVFTVEPGGYTPYHRHNYEHMNYIIDGEGVLVNEEGTEQPIKKGDFALVLPDEKHQYRNISEKQNLVIICGVPVEYE